MRYPSVAGKFYEKDEARLKKQIEDCYTHSLGPGVIPEKPSHSGMRRIKGLVVPHAGYVYSGHIAAHAYRALAEDGWPDMFVVVGPNHTGFGPDLAVTEHDFQMPFGVARVHRESHDICVSHGVTSDIAAHRYEHSIEVQIPFLQQLGDFEFLPVVMMSQSYDSARKLGAIIQEATEGMDVVVIASTDFSHYVPEDLARKSDALALNRIERGDAEGLFKLVKKTGLSMCGYGPVMAMLEATGAKEAKLLAYATSGDVHAMREVVGYAAMIAE